jgi:hypothetical protein
LTQSDQLPLSTYAIASSKFLAATINLQKFKLLNYYEAANNNNTNNSNLDPYRQFVYKSKELNSTSTSTKNSDLASNLSSEACLQNYNNSNYKNHSGNNNAINFNSNNHCLTSEDKLLSFSTCYTTTIVVDVYLLAECCYSELISEFGCNLIEVNSDSGSSNKNNPFIDCNFDIRQTSSSKSSYENASFVCNKKRRPDTFNSYELLERWKISMITSAR